jgi:2-oxoisovalerate dehydrogenase E1 component
MLDHIWARREYPGDQYIIPFGKGKKITQGNRLTLVTWGGMVSRCHEAVKQSGLKIDLIDLRTIRPWDKDMVIESVKNSNRCLIVHEDNISAGFGAEIAATLAKEAFYYLDAPIERLAMPDIGNPHQPDLMNAVVPTAKRILAAISALDQA